MARARRTPDTAEPIPQDDVGHVSGAEAAPLPHVPLLPSATDDQLARASVLRIERATRGGSGLQRGAVLRSAQGAIHWSLATTEDDIEAVHGGGAYIVAALDERSRQVAVAMLELDGAPRTVNAAGEAAPAQQVAPGLVAVARLDPREQVQSLTAQGLLGELHAAHARELASAREYSERTQAIAMAAMQEVNRVAVGGGARESSSDAALVAHLQAENARLRERADRLADERDDARDKLRDKILELRIIERTGGRDMLSIAEKLVETIGPALGPALVPLIARLSGTSLDELRALAATSETAPIVEPIPHDSPASMLNGAELPS